MAVGCRQYRICNTGRCPTGVTSQDALLRSRIEVTSSSQRVENYFRVMRNELGMFTRMTGHTDIHELARRDVSALTLEIAHSAGIQFSGDPR